MSLPVLSSSPMPSYTQQLSQIPPQLSYDQHVLMHNGQQIHNGQPMHTGQSMPNTQQMQHNAQQMSTLSQMSTQMPSIQAMNSQYNNAQIPSYPTPDVVGSTKVQMLDKITNNNNGVGGNGLNNADSASNFTIEHMRKEDIQVHESIMDKDKIAKLREDLDLLFTMNLIDEPEYLDQCLYHAKMFVHKKYVLNFVHKLYMQKYEELVKERPSIGDWLNYCLQSVVFLSEKEFKASCVTNIKSYKIPDLNTKIMIIPSRKRQQQDNCIAEKLIPSKKVVQHPFLDLEHYKLHRLTFHIGECAKHCIPGDFAELEMTSALCTLTKIINTTSTISFDGLRITFKKPLLVPLSGSKRKNFLFLQIERLQPLQEVIASITGLSSTKDSLQFGRAKHTVHVELTTNHRINHTEDETTEDSKHYYFVLITTISVFRRSNKTYQGKAYSDTIYVANRDLTDISSEEMEKYSTVVLDNVATVNAILEEYDQKINNHTIADVAVAENNA